MTPIFLLLLLLPLFLFFLKKIVFQNLPPGPTTFQLFQNLSSLSKKPHVALIVLAKTYGPLMSFRLGGQLIIVASSQAMATEIFKTHNRIFSGRYVPSVYYHFPGSTRSTIAMASDCNDTWKLLRGLGHNFIFSSKANESAAGIRREKVDEMVRFLRSDKAAGEIVSIEDLVLATFTNIITNILASTDLFDTGGQSENDEKVNRFLGSVVEKVTIVGLMDVFPALRGMDFWNKGRAIDLYRAMQLIWVDIITARKKIRHDNDHLANLPTQDFLDVLNAHDFPDGHISNLLTELLIAGTDSTHITVVWLMTEMIKNQEILDKVRNEIAGRAVEGDGTLNESLLSECRYLQACINETLRLHIPSPFVLPRRATETCRVNNFTIPKDSIVMVNAWAIQTDPDNWDDATSFKPERFLDSRVDFKGSHFNFIPFGSGRRMCPGSNVAVKGMQLMVASLVHYFDWSVPNGEDPSQLDTTDRFGTTLKKDKPLYLIPRPRENKFSA